MWIKLSNGQVHLVLNADHIQRILNEGGVEIPDPTRPLQQEAQKESEQPDDSANEYGESDSVDEAQDRRSRRRKSTI